MPVSGGGLTTSPGAVTHKLEADFSGTAFGSAATWTDITSWWMSSGTDPGGQSVTIPWGRQDQSSTVESSTTSFVLNNADGRFTPGKALLVSGAANPYYPNVKRHVRMRHTITDGTTTLTMFDGYVDTWAVTPQTEGPTTSTAALTDTFGRVSASTTLRTMVLEEMLLDAPQAIYPLDEAAGATSVGDQTGTNPSGPLVSSKYGAGTAALGADATGIAGASSVLSLSSPNSGIASTHPAWTAPLLPVSAVPNTGDATFEIWMQGPTTAPTDNLILVNVIPTASGSDTELLILISGFGSPSINVTNASGSGSTGTSGVPNICDGKWHQVVAVLTAAGALNLYVDGVLVKTGTSTAIWAARTSGILLGAPRIPLFASFETPFTGLLALFATYPSALSAGRVLAHYNAGKTAFAGETTSARWSRLRTYRPNIGGTTTATMGTVGSGDITGMSLGDALTDTATAEGGVVQSNRGSLDLIGRANWYNPATTLTLDASRGEVDLPTTWRDDTQGLLNDITVERPNGAAQRAVNAASVTADGVAQTSITANVNSDRDAADMAGWLVAVGVREQIGSPTLTVNLYARASAVLTMAVCALKTYDVVTLTNLPSSAPATTMTFQVQGGTATVGADTFTVELYTTTMPPTVLQLDNPATGLDDPAVVLAW